MSVLTTSPVIAEMLRCLDARLEVYAFGKTHRPEEKQKLEIAMSRLRDLREAYPAHWAMLQRRLGHESSRPRVTRKSPT